jgi:hypothetical protein
MPGYVKPPVNGRVNGTMEIIPSLATQTPLTIKGAVSQSANLLNIQNSAGTTIGYIDSSGRHIKNNPYVMLMLNANSAGPQGSDASKVKVTTFDIIDNTFGFWSSANSRFTCPVTGLYQISISGIKYPQTGAMHIDLVKNGAGIAGNRTRAEETSSYNQYGSTYIVKANANDYFEWFWFGDGGLHSGHGIWSIRLVG